MEELMAACRVLVLQCGSRPGPWACRSLAAAGHAVVAAHDGRSGGATGVSRAALRPLRSPSPQDDPDGYATWLEATVREWGIDVVLPVTEATTNLIAERFDGRIAGARSTGPDRAVYRALCAKDGLAETGARAGVLTPGGVVVRGAGTGAALPPAPCVVKPVTSATPTGAGVVYRAATIAPDAAARDRLVREIAAVTGAVIVQPVVRGRRWRLHFVRSSAGFAAIAWRTVRSSPRATGMSSVSRMVPVPEAMARAGSRLVAAAGYEGIGSLQFIERGDDFVVHDANLRPVYTVGGSTAAGLDLPALAVAIALGDVVPPVTRVRRTRYVWLAGELLGIREDLRARRMGDALRGAGDVVRTAALPGGVLDPADARALVDGLRGLARRRAAGSRGDEPTRASRNRSASLPGGLWPPMQITSGPSGPPPGAWSTSVGRLPAARR
jgi:predicted ATP-grasp superfamily ATP-dependent carboligase